jgi:hypothetical protein
MACYRSIMRTPPEIEAAIEKLPATDKQQLRNHLLAQAVPVQATLSQQRNACLAGLTALRAKVATGKPCVTTDQRWDDLRAERGA